MKEQAQIDAGTIEDISVSVAINAPDFGALDENEVRGLISRSSGITDPNFENNIVVVATPFFENPNVGVEDIVEPLINKNWIIAGAIGFFALLLICLLLFAILRKKKKKKSHIESGDPSNAQRVVRRSNKQEVDILVIDNERGMELKHKVRDFADTNPEISAQLLKNWLKGGEGVE